MKGTRANLHSLNASMPALLTTPPPVLCYSQDRVQRLLHCEAVHSALHHLAVL